MKFFYYNSQEQFYNENGPAMIFLDSNYQEYLIDGKTYREDGPAKFNAGLIDWCI